MVFCHACGTENKEGKFCKSCGGDLKLSPLGKTSIISIIIGLLILGGVFAMIFSNTAPMQSAKKMMLKTLGVKFCGDDKCDVDELYHCKADCQWCGDGTCQPGEEGKCFDDCSWCGDGRCDASEDCNSCTHDCGKCKAQAYCGDGVCNPGECASGCRDCKVTDCQNGACEQEKGENCLNAPADCACGVGMRCNPATGACETKTCGNGRCDADENPQNCPNDCKVEYVKPAIEANKNYPLILLHGHSFAQGQINTGSLLTWKEFQDRLSSDNFYVNQGTILPTQSIYDFEEGTWGRLDKPVSIITTYYSGQFTPAGFTMGEDEKSIDEYAERLAKVIDIVLRATGKAKVDIVAHSMGGLVARTYLLTHGTSKVNKLILVGTPNQGIYDEDYLGLGAFGCSLYHPGIECTQMVHGSNFMNWLNQKETLSPSQYMTIIGNSTSASTAGAYWDGVVRAQSVFIPNAQNVIMNGNGNIHTLLPKPSYFPQAYQKIVGFLK